jgi:hypothetical protein
VRRQRQEGQIIVIAALAMVAILAITSFVVDYGLQRVTERQLQNAADAGALAGAACLGSPDPSCIVNPVTHTVDPAFQARTFAYSAQNPAVSDRICGTADTPLPTWMRSPAGDQPQNWTGSPNVYSSVQIGTAAPSTGGSVPTITVTMTCEAPFTFGRVIGLTTQPIKATATAAKGGPSISCTFPMGMYDSNASQPGVQDSAGNSYALGAYYAMYFTGETGSNSGMLDAGSSSSKTLVSDAMAGACASGGNIVQTTTSCRSGNITVQPPCAMADPGGGNGQISGNNSGLTQISTTYPNGRMVNCSSPSTAPYCAGINTINLPGSPTPFNDTQIDKSCRQQFSDVVNPDGSIKSGQADSPCLAYLPVTPSQSVFSGNGKTPISVIGYEEVFLAGVDSKTSLVVVQVVKPAEVQTNILGNYFVGGAYAISLIG